MLGWNMRRLGAVALLGLAFTLWGCFTVPDYANGQLHCQTGDVCPPGYQCRLVDAAAECAAGTDKRCRNGQPQTCDGTGHWIDATACSVDRPTCDNGDCVSPCVADAIRCKTVSAAISPILRSG